MHGIATTGTYDRYLNQRQIHHKKKWMPYDSLKNGVHPVLGKLEFEEVSENSQENQRPGCSHDAHDGRLGASGQGLRHLKHLHKPPHVHPEQR